MKCKPVSVNIAMKVKAGWRKVVFEMVGEGFGWVKETGYKFNAVSSCFVLNPFLNEKMQLAYIKDLFEIEEQSGKVARVEYWALSDPCLYIYSPSFGTLYSVSCPKGKGYSMLFLHVYDFLITSSIIRNNVVSSRYCFSPNSLGRIIKFPN